MKTASFPALVFTALVSAGTIIALAAVRAQLMPEVRQKPHNIAAASNSPPDATTSQPPGKSQPSKEPLSTPVVSPPVAAKKPPDDPTTVVAQKLPNNSLPVARPPIPPPVALKPAEPPRPKTLTELRADYQREKTQFSQAVSAELAKREAAARSSGDLDALNQAKAARESYAKGIIPKDAPGKDLLELMAVRETLATTLQRELQSAREKKQEPQAAELQKELTEFMSQESADIGDVNWRYPECTFRLVNLATGLALASHNPGNAAGVIQAPEDPSDPMQHWFVRFPGTGHSRVRNRKTELNLNVPASDRAPGREIIMWYEEHQGNGQWELQYRGSYYHVRSHFSGHLLSVPNANKKPGQQLIQWPHHDTPDDQKWKLIRVLPELHAN